MKTRKTKKRNIIRRAVAFLLCMTMVLGLGMQDVIEQVYAEEAIPVIEQEAATEAAGEPAAEEAAPEESADPAEETAGTEETGEQEEPADPAQSTETEEDTEAADPSAPAEDAGTEEGEEQKPSTPVDPAAPTTPAENGQGGSDSETSTETNPDGNTENEAADPAEDGAAVTNPDETAGEETEDDAAVSDEEEETTEPEEDQEPAEEEAQPYEKEETVGNVTIHVYAEAGVLPEDAQLSVTPIEKKEITEDMSEEEKAEAEEINAQYEETEQKLKEDVESETEAAMDDAAANAANTITAENAEADETAGKTLEGFLAYDISFLVNDENGEQVEIEPEGEVKVSFEFDEAVIPEGVSEDAEVSVAHLKEEETENGKEIVVEDMTAAEKATVETTENAEVTKVELATDSFSTFTIYWSTRYEWQNLQIRVVDEDGDDIEASNGKYEYYNGDARNVEDIANEIKVPGYEFKQAKVGYDFGSATQIYRLRYKNYQNQYSTKSSGDKSGDWEDKENYETVWFVYEKATADGLTIDDKIVEEGLLRAVVSGELKQQIENAESDSVRYVWYRSEKANSEFVEIEPIKAGSEYNLKEDNTALDIIIDGADKEKGTVYKVAVFIGDAEEPTAISEPFEIPYYREVQNGSFEDPISDTNKIQSQWSNGEYAEADGVWQTTGLGSINDKDGKDIEVLSTRKTWQQGMLGGTWKYDQGADTNFMYYSDHDKRDETWEENRKAADGDQYAEINCETSGALYQDVLTDTKTELNYWLYHRARSRAADGNTSTLDRFDSMYLVIMPTKTAIEYDTHEKLVDFLNGKLAGKDTIPTEATQNTRGQEEALILYNSDGILIARITSDAWDWHRITSENIQCAAGVEDKQYTPTSSLSRFFFVSGATFAYNAKDNGRNIGDTIGNFVDDIHFTQDPVEADPGTIRISIRKTVSGLTEKAFDELKEKLTFTITAKNPDTNQNAPEAPLNGTVIRASDGSRVTWKTEEQGDGTITATATVTVSGEFKDYSSRYLYTVTESEYDIGGYAVTPSTEIWVTGGEKQDNGAVLGDENSATFEITNAYVSSSADVTFTKTDEAGTPLKGVEFALYKNKEDTAPIEGTEKVSDDQGVVTFEDLESGTYYLKETSTPSGFVAAGPWTIEVGTPAGGYTITGPGVSGDSTEGYKIVNNSFSSSINVDKTVEVLDYEARTYNITLSAKSILNEITQTGEPVDVVLVLDVSRSMWFPGNLKSVDKNASVTNGWNSDLVDGEIYYYIEKSDKATVYEITQRGNGDWYYRDASSSAEGDWRSVEDPKGIFESGKTYEIYQIEDGAASRRLDSLKTAATNFIDKLYELSPENRVGVVPFAENVMDGTENTPNDVIAINTLTENYDALLGTNGYIKGLNYSDTASGTDQREGLDVAATMLKNNPSGNKKYVILLTDGAPNWKNSNGNKVDAETSWEEIEKSAGRLRDEYGATLMTVGVGISYVDIGITASGNNVPLASEQLEKISSVNGDNHYYYNVDQSDELEGVFDSLFSTIVSGIPVENVKITDVIDSRFELVDVTSIPQGGEYDSSTGTITWNGVPLPYVSGDGAGWTVTFTVKAKDEFMGGNVIPTNGSESGVSRDDSTVPFPQPAVNVKALELKVPVVEETIYLGDLVNVAENVAEIKEVLAQKVESDVQTGEEGTFGIPESCQLNEEDILQLLAEQQVSKAYSYGNTGDVVGRFVYTLEVVKTMKPDLTDYATPFDSTEVGDGKEYYKLTVQYVANPIDERPSEGYVYDASDKDRYGEESKTTTAEGSYTLNVIAGSIDIIKKLEEGMVAPKGGLKFNFTVTHKDGTEKEVSIIIPEGKNEGRLLDEEKEKLTDSLKRGEWTVAETAVDGYSVKQVAIGEGTNSESVINAPDGKTITFTMGTAKDGKTDTLNTKGYTEGRLGVAEFTNERVFTDWQIKKVSASDNSVLEGAKFKLESQKYTYYGLSGTDGFVKWYENEECTGIEVTNDKLTPGIYTLSEIYAPSGYSLSEEEWTVEITANGIKSIQNEEGVIDPSTKNEVVVYTFENTILYDLPSAGGPGIYLYMLGGTLLMMAGALLVYKKRKEEVLGG